MNREIARRLNEVADLLNQQDGNPFRIQAYRNAARRIDACPQPLEELLRREGEEGLRQTLGLGERLSAALAEMLRTGRLRILDRLRGEADPETLLTSLPGVGPVWADRLHHDLAIHSLEDLENAVHDGRLAALEGIGPKRLDAIRDALNVRLGRPAPKPPPPPAPPVPVAELLEVDSEYRMRAAQGKLPKIAPRRMNPTREPWLPVLHTTRGPRHYTALYSNTPRAHRLGMTRDWVVLYCDGDAGERQWTVVTETASPLAGRRVVRGREKECEEFYSLRDSPRQVGREPVQCA